jgi:thiamine kinase-like enzyme
MLEHRSNRLVILDWECAMIGDPLYDVGVLQSRYCEDDRLYKGLLHGMTGSRPNFDQCRRSSVYGLVNLVDTLFAYKDRATRAHWQKLNDFVHTLNSPSPNFHPMQERKIKTPKQVPSYMGD